MNCIFALLNVIVVLLASRANVKMKILNINNNCLATAYLAADNSLVVHSVFERIFKLATRIICLGLLITTFPN